MSIRPLSVALLFTVLGCAAAQSTAAGAAVAASDADLRAALARIAARHGVAALGGAIVTVDGLDGAWVSGVRAAGSAAAVTVDDAWHLGSCTKAMTATLIALLVERGDLAWDEKLSALLPDLATAMDAGHRDTTLVELLSHRAGIAPMTDGDAALDRCSALPGSAVAQRTALVGELLRRPPEPADRAFAYSNGGYIVAGHVAERVTGTSWEELMRTLLFAPLGMTTAGFGPPGSAAALDAPRGHDDDGEPVPFGPGADNPPLLGPAGTCHMALADWAKFVQLHLRSARGDVAVGAITLRKATAARLHTAGANDEPRYAGGWRIDERAWARGDHTVWTHAGSNTMWFCVAWCDPAAGFAVLATGNRGGEAGAKATDAVSAELLQVRGARERARRRAAPAEAGGK